MKIKIILFSIFCLLSCNKKEKITINFYYWKTKASITEIEKKYFEELGSKKLYIRLFDIDKNEQNLPYPIAIIENFESSVINAEYIPVIFITNRSLEKISEEKINQLAKNIYNLVNQILIKNKITDFNEIQLDCDWTSSTKSNYFLLVKQLKLKSNKNISSTIRLHQIKYKDKTGIPPVDKGYLMCYATSSPTDKSMTNSILDLNLLKDYLTTINNYPLDLDIALPLYSWGIVTNHVGNIKLINGLTQAELEQKKYIKISDNKYKVPEDQFLHGLYINKDFTIEIEAISPQLLKETKVYLASKINKPYNIVYYHLDSIFLTRFKTEDLL